MPGTFAERHPRQPDHRRQVSHGTKVRRLQSHRPIPGLQGNKHPHVVQDNPINYDQS